MLDLHLDKDAELASRPHAFIERSAEWMKSRFQIGTNTVVFDYGCGPGLYTSRFAQMGANVTGIDFSKRSIQYASEYASEHGLEVTYVLDDYLQLGDDSSGRPDNADLLRSVSAEPATEAECFSASSDAISSREDTFCWMCARSLCSSRRKNKPSANQISSAGSSQPTITSAS